MNDKAKSQKLTANHQSPIPYGRQHITQADIDAVVETLKSDHLTQGPKVKEFEEKFAEYVDSKYAVAVSNGTAALHLCNMALEVKKGDKVITSPITFAASANSVLYCGGKIDFVDITKNTYTLDLNKLEEKLSKASLGTYKGVIPVDFAGYPIDVERLRQIADKYNLWIIEDACHAPGGYFIDSNNTKQLCGNGNYADLAIFSFHPVKHIATGEGGMITTNDKDLYDRLRMLRTHGITKDHTKMLDNHGDWYYEMQELGFNYRLSDIQAALGTSQLKRVDNSLERRKDIARKYYNSLQHIKGILGQSGVIEGHAYHLYIIEVEDRKKLYKHLNKNNIFVQVHYIPVHLQPYYQKMGWKKGNFPIAEQFYKKCLSLPMFPSMSEEELDYVIHVINEFFK